MFFFKKTVEEKIEKWVEDRNANKLIKMATTDANHINRAKAYDALGRVRVKECLETLLDCFKLGETDIVRAAAARGLEQLATRKEFDAIQHFIDAEESPKVKEALKNALLSAKERSPRW